MPSKRFMEKNWVSAFNFIIITSISRNGSKMISQYSTSLPVDPQTSSNGFANLEGKGFNTWLP